MGTAATARVPLDMTLAALAEERDDPRLAQIAGRLAGELQQGKTIDEAVVRAPLPGRVVQVRAEVGMEVEKGQLLAVLDAMKMEHRLLAPCSGKVVQVAVAEGDRVVAGQILVELAP